MSQNPFRRLVVYNSVHGSTYVFWELSPWFNVSGDYYYTLQVSRIPSQEAEWTDIGTAILDPPYLTDSETETYGMVADKYYRVVLQIGSDTWVSNPSHCHGQLTQREWKIANEIIRKERLRFRYTAVPVTLLKKKRYGEKCTHCTSELIDGTTNSECPYCFGTGYAGGYHTPVTMQMMDISPSRLREVHAAGSTATFNIAVDKYQARALGLPELNEGDIIVDKSTDQRFQIIASPVTAQMHRVPLVRDVEMALLPASDIAYTIATDEDEISPGTPPSLEGCGSIRVDSLYLDGLLTYQDPTGNPIVGATVTIYRITGDIETQIGATVTSTGGLWLKSFMLDPGVYRIEFEKLGEFGPDSAPLTLEGSADDFTHSPDYLTVF